MDSGNWRLIKLSPTLYVFSIRHQHWCSSCFYPIYTDVTTFIKDYAEDEAKKLVEKVEGILAGVTSLKKGLSAIRQKDIDEIRNIVEEIDNSDWIRILRERYGDSALAQRLANDLEKMRSRCNLLMEKFADMLRNGFILMLEALPYIRSRDRAPSRKCLRLRL